MCDKINESTKLTFYIVVWYLSTNFILYKYYIYLIFESLRSQWSTFTLHLKRFSVLVPENMYVISLIIQRLNDYFEWSWPIYLLRVSFVCKIFFALKRTFISQIWLILFCRFKFQFIESYLPRRHPKSWNIWIEWRTSSIPPAWFATKFLCFPWFYE